MKHSYVAVILAGVTMTVFGVHQMTEPSRWSKYVPAWLERLSPIPTDALLRIHASGNILLGVGLLSGRKHKTFLRLAGGWWLWVAPFCGRSDWRTAVRDITIGGMLIAVSGKK